jgi:2',3'-cyclic-nucleotide 2'-phosphodiesterase/3'-nucleotidase
MNKKPDYALRALGPGLTLTASAAALVACGGSGGGGLPPVTPNTRATLALLETTDLHTNVMSYDYFKLATDSSLATSAWPP